MHNEQCLYLNEHGWRTLQESSGKSIYNHANPKTLINRLGVRADAFSRIHTLNRTSEYLSLKENYRRSLSSAFAQGRGAVKQVMSYYFPMAYAYGIRSQGILESATDIVRKFTEDDKQYIRIAVEEDVDYAAGFIRDMEGGFGKMAHHKRFQMYVEALDAVFNAGATAAMPSDILIYWTGPADKDKCRSCSYLVSASPFIPETLPCQPRDGTTLCGSNCRDRLVIRPARPEEVTAQRLSAQTILQQHNEALENIRYNRKQFRGIPKLQTTFKPIKLPQPPKVKVNIDQMQPLGPKSFYTQKKPKGKAMDIQDLIWRYKRYMSDSNEQPAYNNLTEGLLSGIRFIQGTKKILDDVKALHKHLDVTNLYVILQIKPFSTTGLVRAGRYDNIRQWVNTAEYVHKEVTRHNLQWTIIGVTSYERDAEARSSALRLSYGRVTQAHPGDVWISNPKDRDGVFSDMFGELVDATNPDSIALLQQRGSDAKTHAAKMKYSKDQLTLLGAAKFVEYALRKFKKESVEIRRDRILKSVMIENKRECHILTEESFFKKYSTQIITAAALTGYAAYRALSGIVGIVRRIDFLTIYIIIRIQPFGGGSPIYMAGDSTSMIEWIKKADKYHQIQYGKPLKWEIDGITSFRDWAESYKGARWITDPNDDASIIEVVVAEFRRQPKEVNPKLLAIANK